MKMSYYSDPSLMITWLSIVNYPSSEGLIAIPNCFEPESIINVVLDWCRVYKNLECCFRIRNTYVLNKFHNII